MSQITIRSILETQLATIVPKVSTQYENVVFTPVTNVPYQSAYLLMNKTNDVTISDSGVIRDSGIFQVTLRYPIGNGTVVAMTQAEKIRVAFRKGYLPTKDGHRVLCDKTPDIRVLPNEVDRFVVTVRVYFTVDIFT